MNLLYFTSNQSAHRKQFGRKSVNIYLGKFHRKFHFLNFEFIP